MDTDVALGQRGYPITVARFGALVAVLASMLLPIPAQAGQGQLTVVRDDRQLWQSGETARENALNDMLAQGVDVVQIFVNWNQVAPEPDSLSKPSFVDESDSTTYSSAYLSEIDAAVRSATQKGIKVMVNPVGPAPAWASTEKGNDRFRGQYPGLAHWTRFVGALARRYSGHFDPGDGRGVVPAVRWWGIWNEPNFGAWLQPQWERSDILGRKIPRSPHFYRKLYERGAKQIRKAGGRGVKLFLFDLGPVGDNRRGGGSGKSASTNVDPKLWLYEFFCLDERGRPLRGKDRQARGCPRHFRKIKAYAVAHHPHTAGSTGSPMSSADAPGLTLQNTDELIKILDRAARRKRIRSRIPVYFTEFGIRTKESDAARASAASFPMPPGPGGPPPGSGGRPPGQGGPPPGPPGPGEATREQQAQYINEAEYLNYEQSRVRSYSQYPWVDDPISESGAKGWQSGLYSSDHQAKPSYDAFRLPIFVSKRGCNKVMVWGRVRPGGGSSQVEIQSGSGSSFITVKNVTVEDSRERYFKTSVSGTAVCAQQWRLLWVDGNGASHTSRTATPSSHR